MAGAGTELTAHFWDFGGQVIAHATHQFFLRARCVYVLVLNARSADSNPNQQAEYWLEFIRAFGADAPVLLVGNKCDLTPVAVDTRRLQEGYPNIRGFYPLSTTQYTGAYAREFAIFRDAFIAQLQMAGETQPYFSRQEFALIEKLRERSRRDPFLEKGAFDAECEQRGIDGVKQQDFLTLLDQLGEVIWFPDLFRVYGFREYLLNPRWLTYGVYQLLYSELLKRQHGELHRGDVTELLKDRAIVDEHGNRLPYPEERLGFLIQAMTEFKLCYPAPESPNDKWIVPELLPSDQPERLAFPKEDALRFDFRFATFLPRHVLSQFIVEHYLDIRDNQAWQHGVCLKSRHWGDTLALVQANYQSRVLSLAVVGSGSNVERYFSKLYASILDILGMMPELEYTKWLRLNEQARIGVVRPMDRKKEAYADFEDLLAQEADGVRIYHCKFGRYSLEKLLRPMLNIKEEEGQKGSKTGIPYPEGSNPPVSGLGLWERIILILCALCSLLAGIGTYSSLEDKAMGVAAGAGIGVVILATLIAWLWHRKRSNR